MSYDEVEKIGQNKIIQDFSNREIEIERERETERDRELACVLLYVKNPLYNGKPLKCRKQRSVMIQFIFKKIILTFDFKS